MLNLGYYYILSTSYAVALLGWWLILSRFQDKLLPHHDVQIKKPWRQVAGIVVAIVAIVLIGRLYSNHLLLPPIKFGSINFSECINQLLIFSPILLFFAISKQSITTAWLPKKFVLPRLAIGVALALVAVMVFVVLSNRRGIMEVEGDTFHIKNLHFAVQIFMEDLGLALLLSRLAAALGQKYFIVGLVAAAVLFAGGHLPTNLEEGKSLGLSLLHLSIDAGLVVGVGALLYKSKDFIWFFPIHFAMDMMQFYSGL